ncbi:hypothetical protein HA466_0007970 [Hirschfeldia incana]|nr:hypothetical protein HA466_0007970 [Hirschfeldia incana]KAJ0266875.1 hypothetical protein HA466_0007970 [Hirschfeldia incana]KAJ0266876.1 hypothetical protein HA466_0007970 [Hirschfeldia incana]
MGTKIVEKITSNSFGLESVDFSGFVRFGVDGQRKSATKKLTDDKEEEAVFVLRSMDRFLEKQNAESIRRTMQAQEDLFKQQVRELHRVYNIQKKMMEQLKHRNQYCTTNNQDQTGPRERTGSWSGIDLENVARASNTTTADHIEESELELTLSIGISSSSTNKDMDYSSTTSFKSSSDNCNNQSNNINNNHNNNQESSGPNTPMSSSSTTSLDREKKRPHWLFQGLSINRTS